MLQTWNNVLVVKEPYYNHETTSLWQYDHAKNMRQRPYDDKTMLQTWNNVLMVILDHATSLKQRPHGNKTML